MKFVKLVLSTAILGLLVGAMPAIADWSEGDGHKMHYPQLPDEAGWDVNASGPIFLAEDWQCSQSGWVEDIHFWGSWKHDLEGIVIGFNLTIYEDIPADPPAQPFSMPGAILWQEYIEVFDFIAIDPPSAEGWFDPLLMVFFPDDHQSYFQYNVFLDTAQWFWQDEGVIYWLGINAIVADVQSTEWGWKSSLDHWNDDAVWSDMPDQFWEEIYEPPGFTQSLDLAFVINGGGDYGLKWEQLPDLLPTGMDVAAYHVPGFMEYILADDFPCVESGPIRVINVWGSWWGDYLPYGDPANVWFTLSIHEDIPADLNPYGFYSMPGDAIWIDSVPFTVSEFADSLFEGWLEPPDYYDEFGDEVCWKYTFYLDSNEFIQEGTPEDPIIYWLNLQAHSDDPDAYFGWKTSLDHWNDDAVWTLGVEPLPGGDPPWEWWELIYPFGHPYEGQSIDLAFSILGEESLPGVDTVVCEPQPPDHPPYYWYDVTPGNGTARYDFHIIVFDSIIGNYSNWIEPAGWTHALLKFGNDWWVCFCNPLLDAPITSTTRFGFDNDNPWDWGEWRTTNDGMCDPYTGLVDSSENHLGEPNGYGYKVHVPFDESFGACCLEDGSCIEVSEDSCANLTGAEFMGDGTACMGDINGNDINDICESWQPGDPHKMHYPQLPDTVGWDVRSGMGVMLADDWMCSESGCVKDIHLWGSWRGDTIGDVQFMLIGIFENIPAQPPVFPFSRPGAMLFNFAVSDDQIVERPFNPPTYEGWYDPSIQEFIENDHVSYYQYDIYLDRPQWFFQEEGTIYWLGIMSLEMTQGTWGWKSSYEHWNDNAVWSTDLVDWHEIYEPPDFDLPLDLAFVITGDYECRGLCGDANGDLIVNVSDAVWIINYIFVGGGPPRPVKACGDANSDCMVNVSDAVYIINYVFVGGPPPGDCCPCGPDWLDGDCCPFVPTPNVK